ncbi:hypothetical protein AMATHDRAFT_1728 [Amanita thiersii Skay4041]|uniref:Sodium/calcium exchanger membrane region domain-containing protein n=1 Tax=Amanita thiersii Skay4041 TaxID=703135 RepID=A0A2A9NYP0_9AGAR|nr:hypothetical protein AMATHDRAFT_1728 [Amanita thiersii Skay4041]
MAPYNNNPNPIPEDPFLSPPFTSTLPRFSSSMQPLAARRASALSQVSLSSTTHLVERDISRNSPVEKNSSTYFPTSDSAAESQMHKHKKGFLANVFYGWRTVVFGSWLNLLLVLLPISWALSITMKSSQGVVFAFCILSLVPLVKVHDLATRDLAIRIGGSKTGLVNASMANMVEIVVALSALMKCELEVVQSALIGSILSKILLILGLCFFAGGMRFSEQGFDATATQVHSSLLCISVGAVILPGAYHFALGGVNQDSETQARNILHMSHGVSVILVFIYAGYLMFQLWSHPHLYHDNHNKKSNRLSLKLPLSMDPPAFLRGMKRDLSLPHGKKVDNVDSYEKPKEVHNDTVINLTPPRRPYLHSSSSELTLSNTDSIQEMSMRSSIRLVQNDGHGGIPLQHTDTICSDPRKDPIHPHACRCDQAPCIDHGDPEVAHETTHELESQPSKPEPQLSWQLTVLVLVLVTLAVSITADRLVEAMDGISNTISKEWAALILLPVASSIAECITAVNGSVKDQLTLSISVAIGSAIQTSLLVIPCVVILGWITHRPLALLMDPFQSLVLYIAVQTSTYVMADGKSNWLEGMILVCLYIIIAVSFWFYPGVQVPSSLSICPGP